MRLVRLEEVSAKRGNSECNIGASCLCGVHETSNTLEYKVLVGRGLIEADMPPHVAALWCIVRRNFE